MARRRTARSKREPAVRRTQPEAPRLLLSTIPFLALFAVLAVMAVAVIITAWPGSQPRPVAHPVVQQQGIAPRGWMQEAEKEFRHS